jgi:hypothetical protein
MSHHHLSSLRRSLTAATVTSALVCAALVSGAVPASASTCPAGSVQKAWTGSVDSAWATDGNWEPAGVPAEADKVDIPAAATVTGATGTVCDVKLGGAAAGVVSLTGELALTGDLVVTANTEVSLGDASVLTLGGAGSLLGDGSTLRRLAGATGAVPEVHVTGTLALAGDATADTVSISLLNTNTGGGKLNHNGQSLTLTGAATSYLKSGASITNAGGITAPTGQPVPGVVVKSGAHLLVANGGTIGTNATLRLEDGSVIGSDGASATLAGSGTLNWKAGTLAGSLTLALATTMDGGSIRIVPAGTTLTNTHSAFAVKDGTVQVDGTLVNAGTLRASPGVAFSRVGSTGLIDNQAAGVLAVGVSDTAAATGSGLVRLVNVALQNAGKITIVGGAKLQLLGNPDAPTVSNLAGGSLLRDPFTPVSGSTPPVKGTLQVGLGTALRLSGTTTMQNGAILQLDDGPGAAGNGTKAELIGVLSSSPKLVGTAATDGMLQWRSGTIKGPLTIDKVSTDVGANSADSRRILDTGDDGAAATLTLAGPTALNATKITLRPNTRVLTTAVLTVASAPAGFERSTATVEGQKVTVGLGGTLRRIANTATSFSTGPATIDVPLVNHGTVTLETSLNVPAGYTQDIQPGAASTAAVPVTGLLASTVTLSGSNGAGQFAPITLTKGGLGGTGTITANPLTIGTTWVHPGFSDRAGKLIVQGTLKLSSGSDVQLVMRGTTDDKKDILQVVPLLTGTAPNQTTVAPGRAELNGKVTGMSAGGFAPAYGSVVQNLVQFEQRTGSFTSASWNGTPRGLGWKPVYDDTASPAVPAAGSTPAVPADPRSVDLRLLDVAAPALGIASIPAFTQFTSQRITYAAVDNKTGVRSYDVRWQRGSPTRAYGAWVYPSSWQGTTATAKTLTGLVKGYTYCFSVRARDKAGNVSAWSQGLCTGRMYDDRSFAASRGWSRPSGKAGFYSGTYSRSTTYGAKLTKSGTFTRVAVTGLKCPTCGTVGIYSGTTLLKTLSLRSSSTGITTWVSGVRSSATTTLTVKVLSRGKPVVIDSFGMVR